MLPVWLLLAPRDYLSAFMKIGVVAFLVLGVIIVNPTMQMPAFTQYVGGGGPDRARARSSRSRSSPSRAARSPASTRSSAPGTTPKMIDKESHIRPIGYGAMLMEGLVGVIALIAAASLHPADYFAINTPPAVYATLGQVPVELPGIEAAVGETVDRPHRRRRLAGRRHGADLQQPAGDERA